MEFVFVAIVVLSCLVSALIAYYFMDKRMEKLCTPIAERFVKIENKQRGDHAEVMGKQSDFKSTLEYVKREFEIISARFHHTEKKLAGMTRTVNHTFTGKFPVKLDLGETVEATSRELLKRAGITK